MRRLLTPSLITLVVGSFSACTSAPPNLAVVANAPGTFQAGEEQRLLVSLVDQATSDFLASPDRSTTAILTSPDDEETAIEADFLWTVQDVVGLYLIRHTFETAGTWWVQLKTAGLGTTDRTPFSVTDSDPVPGIGDPAPPVATRTLADHDIGEISSDFQPDPNLYQLSIDQALETGKPLVVVFASPAFCVSQTCGPMLDLVKAVAADHPDANYIHVEVYTNLDAATPDDLIVDPAVRAWGLPSEPWTFVIRSDGRVAARFEGAMLATELEAALSAVGA